MAFVYSCCFWFSLRLGGILTGIFSLAVAILTIGCLSYSNSQQVKDVVTDWMNNLEFGYYMNNLLESLKSDPERYCSLAISITCIYIFVCLLFIYGAYTCNNTLMIAYLLSEATRLVVLSVMVAQFLLLLKQNTMDIGLLIGASVTGGFLLLGMFYLWLCAVNLPILINEMKLDEQAATISKLQKLLEVNNRKGYTNGVDNIPYATDYKASRNMFVISRNPIINGYTPDV